MIPYGTQNIDAEDINAVVEALKSTHLTQGEESDLFERDLAAYTRAKYAISFNSATSALMCAYRLALHVMPSVDAPEFITSPVTFCATANMMLENNVTPVFAPIKPDGIIDEDKLERYINPNTRAIVSVDYAGTSADATKLRQICTKHGLMFITDAAHSLGANFNGHPVGSLADLSIFSFHPLKSITTFEGGAITTNNLEHYFYLDKLRNHGLDKSNPLDPKLGMSGFNFRLSSVASALGRSQLRKIDDFIARRREIASYYTNELKDRGDVSLVLNTGDSSAHLFPILLRTPTHKTIIIKELMSANIGVQIHYKPLYLFDLYKNMNTSKETMLSANDFYSRVLSIPLHTKLSANDTSYIMSTLKRLLDKYRD